MEPYDVLVVDRPSGIEIWKRGGDRLRDHFCGVRMRVPSAWRTDGLGRARRSTRRAASSTTRSSRPSSPEVRAVTKKPAACLERCHVFCARPERPVEVSASLPTKVEVSAQAKIRRTLEKQIPGAPHDSLLVVDAAVGRNAVDQARGWQKDVGVTGLAVTKLDGTALPSGVYSVALTCERDEQSL